MNDEMNDEKKFLECSAKVSEHFRDYLIIARKRTGELRWRYSDSAWAIGSAKQMTEFTLSNVERVKEDEDE